MWLKKTVNRSKYGTVSNCVFILSSIWKYQKMMFFFFFLEVITVPIKQFFLPIISKTIIEFTVNPEIILSKNIALLIPFSFAFLIIINNIQTSVNTESCWRSFYVRMKLMEEKNKKAMEINYADLEQSHTLDIIQRATNSCNSGDMGCEGLIHELYDFGVNLSCAIIGIIILTSLNYAIIICIFVLTIVSGLINTQQQGKIKILVWNPLGKWYRKYEFLRSCSTNISSAKEIRIFNLKNIYMNIHKHLVEERLRFTKTESGIFSKIQIFQALIWAICQIGVYGYLIYSIFHRDLTVAQFSLYLSSSVIFFNKMASCVNQLSNIFARAREVSDYRLFLDQQTNSTYKNKALLLGEKFTIEFKNVYFKYPNNSNFVLKNINIKISSTEHIAIVGLNGAGKTTFIKLLMGIYEPTKGEILINGISYKNYSQKSLFNVFSPVFQETNLFAFNTIENIAMKTKQNINIDKINLALNQVNLKQEINKLGLNTILIKGIYDDGIDLSGGEKQKIALLRAIYKDSPIFILDEPSSALDPLSEAALYKQINIAFLNKTVIFITHQLSSTKFCKNIVFFSKGQISEYGSHDDLMLLNGEYARLFSIQASNFKN